jgi:hypothetical protein
MVCAICRQPHARQPDVLIYALEGAGAFHTALPTIPTVPLQGH